MHQAHLKALRLVSEKFRGGKMDHEDWSRLLVLTAERITPIMVGMRLQELPEQVLHKWSDLGDFTTDWQFVGNIQSPRIRGIFGWCGETIWGLTQDQKWLLVKLLPKNVPGQPRSVGVRWLASPGEISKRTGDLDEFVYSHLWSVTRRRKEELERKSQVAARVLGEFDAEVNLFQAHNLK